MYSYILAPAGIKLFQEIYAYKKDTKISKLFQIGDSAPISFFEVGDFVHAVEGYTNQGPIFGRSAGTFCQVRAFEIKNSTYSISEESQSYVKLRLPSGSLRLVNFNAQATFGSVAEKVISNKNFKKAGRTR
jgi:ribosomal protein L2